MATEKMATTLTLQTDSVKRLILHDTISYVLALKPQTPRAIQFQNITIQVASGKTTAFLSTYYPDKEWLDDWRKDKRMAFKGTVTFNKINLDEIVAPPNNGVITSQNAGLKGKIIASIGNTDMMVTDRISLAPGECEIYDVYSLVPYPCSTGDMPGHCIWETNDGLTMGDLDYLPGYRIDKNTVINCAMPQFPNSGNGGSGGGGNTTPNPPGSYDPCNGGPQPVQPGGIAFERGTRLMVAAPTECDPTPPSPNQPFVPTVTSRQFLLDNIDFSAIELSYINDPINAAPVNALANHLLIKGVSPDNNLFIKWAVGYLKENSGINFEDFKSEYLNYTLNPSNTNDVAIINNGVEINDAPTVIPNSPKPIIGSTTNRNNTEDMTYGTNHDASGVNPQMLTKSDATLFISMKDLISVGTTRDGELRQVALDFIDIFRNNSSINTIASNPILNKKVEVSAVFANFVKAFGAELQTRLKQTGGDITGIVIDMRQIRPIFNGNYNMVAGLTILLNDTEQSTIRLESYDKLSNGEFIAVIEVTIMDHFGLDKHDVLSKQHIHDGFAAWWILQHNRGFVPFQTKIISRKTINGYWK